MAVSERSKACVALAEDLSLRVIDVSNRRVSAALWAHHRAVLCLAVAGTQVLSLLALLVQKKAQILTPVAGTQLISAGADELLVLWDISRRHEAACTSGSTAQSTAKGGEGVSSVGDGWGGRVPARGGMYGIGGNSDKLASASGAQAEAQEGAPQVLQYSVYLLY